MSSGAYQAGSPALRRFEHALLDALLLGGLFSPVAWAFVGTSGRMVLNLPTRVAIAIALCGATIVASVRLEHRAQNLVAAAVVKLGAVTAAAVAIALVLEFAANSFYTAPALMDGMAALLVVRVIASVLRWRAVVRREKYVVMSRPNVEASNVRPRRHLTLVPNGPRARPMALPSVALADALASVSAWSLLAFWILVALEHRHIASVVLVFTSVLLVLACVILIPDALAGQGLLPRGMTNAPWTTHGPRQIPSDARPRAR
ncbi:MAG: hypothetical protein ABI625_15190 [bacterium]